MHPEDTGGVRLTDRYLGRLCDFNSSGGGRRACPRGVRSGCSNGRRVCSAARAMCRFSRLMLGDRVPDGMNRIFWVVRSMTKNIIELSRGVVAAPPPMGKVTAESESISSTCRRRRLPIDGTSIQDPVAEVVRSRRRARIGAIHPGAGSVSAEAPARPGSANSAIQLSAAAGHHGSRSAHALTHESATRGREFAAACRARTAGTR